MLEGGEGSSSISLTHPPSQRPHCSFHPPPHPLTSGQARGSGLVLRSFTVCRPNSNSSSDSSAARSAGEEVQGARLGEPAQCNAQQTTRPAALGAGHRRVITDRSVRPAPPARAAAAPFGAAAARDSQPALGAASGRAPCRNCSALLSSQRRRVISHASTCSTCREIHAWAGCARGWVFGRMPARSC